MEGANIASPLLTASIQYVLNVLLTLPAIIYLDRFGRRPALLIGSVFMALFLFIVGALQASYGQPNVGALRTSQNSDITWIIHDNKPVSKVMVSMTYLFVCTFATTWGPTSWTYPSEIYPTKIRAKAVSLSTASNWFWNCVLAFAVPPLLTNSKAPLSFSVSAVLSLTALSKLENVYDLWYIQRLCTNPHVLHRTRDQRENIGGNGRGV